MVFPVCTPLAVDPGHPFPHISNLSLNLAVELQDPDGRRHFARVKVPNVLPRLVAASPAGDGTPMARRPRHQCLCLAGAGAGRPPGDALPADADRWKCIPSASSATPTSRSRSWRPTTCSKPWSSSLARSGASARRGALIHQPRHAGADLRTLLAENLESTENDIYALNGPLGLSDLIELTRWTGPT